MFPSSFQLTVGTVTDKNNVGKTGLYKSVSIVTHQKKI